MGFATVSLSTYDAWEEGLDFTNGRSQLLKHAAPRVTMANAVMMAHA